MSMAARHAAPGTKKRLGEGAKYSRADVLRLREIFDKHDHDNNGRVTISELLAANAFKNHELAVFRMLDVNRNGYLTFNEYLRRLFPYANDREFKVMLAWGMPHQGPPPEPLFEPTSRQLEEIKMLFNMMDRNRNGVIEVNELLMMAQTCGYEETDIANLFKKTDVDMNGSISFNEFVQLVRTSYI
ncbi:hypothetical protein Agub_g5110 [Astrephomene gubernaculifera]|uniref:EF-hand domain-containing protein n=1 Tax=Astrephomene gubernaculifera TaxID=47775 RepID=A0AAD3DNF0_9CHLO|nr:hypothetical protein Agub_g5110 [Astrephomene gubernaculifera]